MNIDKLTIGDAKQLASLLGSSPTIHQPYQIGKAYLIRTVTHIDIGVVVEVGPTEIVMKDVSWIADTGRYADALLKGSLSEVEPYPNGDLVIIGRGAVVDAVRWNHPLPRDQR